MVKRFLIPILMTVFILGVMGCGEQTYNISFERQGFKSDKAKYAAGEEVTVYYPLVATDTDYYFSAGDDVNMTRDYDQQKGIILKFVMPARDVFISIESRNTMTIDPNAIVNPGEPWNCPDCKTVNYGKFCSQCGSERPEKIGDWTSKIDENSMAFDYYEAVLGTVGGDHYTELTLNFWEGEGLVLARYTKEEGSKEVCKACQVPESVLNDCLDAIRSSGLDDSSEGSGGMTGKTLVIKYKKNDEVIRISSEDTDNTTGFDLVSSILRKAWSEYYVAAEDNKEGSASIQFNPVVQMQTGDEYPDNSNSGNSVTDEAQGEVWFCQNCGRRNTGPDCLDCGQKKPEE